MILRERVSAVVDELKRLKREGVTTVAVSDEALALLRTALARETAPVRAVAGVVDPGPASNGDRAVGPVPSPGVGAPGEGTRPTTKDSAPNTHSRAVAPEGAISASAPTASALLDLVKPSVRPVSRPVATAAASSAPKSSGKFPPPPKVELPAGTKREQWDWLRRRVLDCPVCKAHTHGDNQVVFGVGNIDADIFFCGEAPGGEEEIQGEPFVGPAGQVLTKMIIGMGLKREDVYIGNILNWRPEMEGRASGKTTSQTGNRPPTEEEMNFGLPYLRAQVAVVKPKVIVALGSTAAQGLLGFGSFKSLGSIRGKWLEYQGTPLMVTYHPSYLLRYADAKTKRMVWEDMLMVMERVGLPISEKQRGFFK